MKANRLAPLKYIRRCVGSGRARHRTPGTDTPPASHHVPEPVGAGFEKMANNHKECVTLPQRMVGISRTEGRSLVQDIRLVKCHSSGHGAPRASTRIAPTYIRHAELLLIHQQLAAASKDRDGEEVRSLARSIVRDIVAGTK